MKRVDIKRFLTSFGMTFWWVGGEGRSGDSPDFYSFSLMSGANRHFFLSTLINELSFRAVARNLNLIINYSRHS